jgi:hypothetical protein
LLLICNNRKKRETLFWIFLDEHPKSLPLPPPNTDLVERKKRRQMDRLRRTLSFRSRKKGNASNNNNNNNNHASTTTAATTTTTSSIKNGNNTPTTTTTTAETKPSQWQDDEKSVRMGACSFNVKVWKKKEEMFLNYK